MMGRAGRVEVHSHLLPGVDDGCRSPEESVACARVLVQAGYTDAFCTPHILPMYPHNAPDGIARAVARLQGRLDSEGVGLRVWPGGELTLASRGSPTVIGRRQDVITYGFGGKWVLFDFWEEDADEAFRKLQPAIVPLREWGFELLCAHPERIAAVHREPSLVDRLAGLGVRFQLNSWCLCEPRGSVVRDLAEKWLLEGRYWVMGMDIHRLEGMEARVGGVERAVELVGRELVEEMTVKRARELMPRKTPD